MRLLVIVFLAFVAAIECRRAIFEEERDDSMLEWGNWKAVHGKTYHNTVEEDRRQKIFEKRRKMVEQHNKNPHATYKLAMNKFADGTKDELAQLLLKSLLQTPRNQRQKATIRDNFKENLALSTLFLRPSSLDWRSYGAVTGVKDQGSCGACYAFVATGALESRSFLKNASAGLVRYSEQEIIDCSVSYGNDGCYGGWMTNAYDYVTARSGINKETNYPFVYGENSVCHANSTDLNARVIGSAYVPLSYPPSEIYMLNELQSGPIAIGFAVMFIEDFVFYESGIYAPSGCICTDAESQINHAMLLVGYTNEAWIVKNSWGTWWGDAGYIYIDRSQTNLCCILEAGVYPILPS